LLCEILESHQRRGACTTMYFHTHHHVRIYCVDVKMYRCIDDTSSGGGGSVVCVCVPVVVVVGFQHRSQ